MLNRFDRRARKRRFKGQDAEEFKKWRASSKSLLESILGINILKEESNVRIFSTNAIQTESVSIDGIVRERWLIHTENNVAMPFYVLLPKDADHRTMPFICPPGHGGAGKSSVAGLRDYSKIREKIRNYNYDYGLQLTRMGYAAICPDMRGTGERREIPFSWNAGSPDLFSCDCAMLRNMCEPLGITVLGMFTWDLMKLSDWIVQRGKDDDVWDSKKLSCLGFSGGGMQTMFLSALDERIHFSVISGYLYGYRNSLLSQPWNCACNYVPHLWEHFDMGDIASLIAPRPILIQSCSSDRQNGADGIDNVLSQVDIIRNNYQLLHANKNIALDLCEGPHRFHHENLKKHIKALTGS